MKNQWGFFVGIGLLVGGCASPATNIDSSSVIACREVTIKPGNRTPSSTAGNTCEKVFTEDSPKSSPNENIDIVGKKAPAQIQLSGNRVSKTNAEIRALVESLGIPGKPVVHTPPRAQRGSDLCWDFATNGLAEARKYSESGVDVRLSDDMGFFLVYTELKSKLRNFRALSKKIAAAPRSAEANEIRNFYLRPDRSAPDDANKYYLPGMGNPDNEKYALSLIKAVGLAPEGVSKVLIRDEDKDIYEKTIRRFVGEYMLKAKNLDRYIGKDDDDVNGALWNDLAQYLQRFVPIAPPRPNETFSYRGQTYTRLSFMKDYMKFDPDDFVSFEFKPKLDVAKVLDAAMDSIDRNIPVPIGIRVFSDPATDTGLYNFLVAKESGVFSNAFCPDGVCKEFGSGHEMLVVNYIRDPKTGKPTALIVKNSWGEKKGLDVYGNLAKTEDGAGYYIVTADYLKNGLLDFTLRTEIANLPQYKHKFSAE